MNHINCVPEPGNIEQPVFAPDVNSDLIYAGTNRTHRLPIARLHIVLNQFEFITRLLPNRFGATAYLPETVANALNRFEDLPQAPIIQGYVYPVERRQISDARALKKSH